MADNQQETGSEVPQQPFTANALADYVRRLFHIESGGDPNAVTGSNRGLGQWGHPEERRYGITDANRTDPAVQTNAVVREYAENNARLARILGRAPTFADHYLTHQQGVAGGPALLSADPQTPAWQVIRPFYKSDRIAQQAITGNIPRDSPLRRLPVDQISAGGFTGLWQDRFNRGLTRVGLSGEAPPVSAEAGPVSPALQNAMQPGQAAGNQVPAPPMPAPVNVAAPPGGVASAASPLAPPVSGVQALLTGLGSPDNKGTGTFGDISKSLMTAAGKNKGLPFPDAKLKPFDQNLRPLPLNLPNFAAMAQIPKFAEGGIVDRPTLAMVGEAGPEAIVPLTGQQSLERRMSDLGSDIPRNALDARALLNSGAIRITHPGDGRGGFTRTDDPNDFSIVSHYNDLAGGTSNWPNKPESHEAAIIALNNAHQPGPGPLYNGKYNQILWSAQRLGVNPFKAIPR